ncbi:MAG: hypothetical protein K0U40_00305 [Betaproteobacteria bacterium]|nr:hypothetical protein [Betaproteobacteria bacterium]
MTLSKHKDTFNTETSKQNFEVGFFVPPAEASSNKLLNHLTNKIREELPDINIVIFKTEQPEYPRIVDSPTLLKKDFLHRKMLEDIVFPYLSENKYQNPNGILLPPELLAEQNPGRVRVITAKNPNSAHFIYSQITGNSNLKMAFSVKNLTLFGCKFIKAVAEKNGPGSLINTHPAALPNIRGLEGPFWTRVLGESQYTTTMHAIDEDIDTGPIIDYVIKPINGSTERAVSMYPLDAAEDVANMIFKHIHLKLVRNGKASAINFQAQDKVKSHYFSLPNEEDLEKATKKGIQFSDESDIINWILSNYSNSETHSKHYNMLTDLLNDAYHNGFTNNSYQKPVPRELKVNV